jgi:hypothetical protein
VRGGSNALPEFGGGFTPLYGLAALLTTVRAARPSSVFPDSKIAR